MAVATGMKGENTYFGIWLVSLVYVSISRKTQTEECVPASFRPAPPRTEHTPELSSYFWALTQQLVPIPLGVTFQFSFPFPSGTRKAIFENDPIVNIC